ncbi:MAG: hypothetical protein LUG98_02800, partial [Tannerellaceae bacterium]|nr:hypothetical protein [Tannerellaceae bacterium]
LKALEVEINSYDYEDDDFDGLYFPYSDAYEYVAISRTPEEDEEFWIEKDDQGYSTTALPSSISYTLNRNELRLLLTEEIANEIRTDKELILQFELDDQTFSDFEKVVHRIFS